MERWNESVHSTSALLLREAATACRRTTSRPRGGGEREEMIARYAHDGRQERDMCRRDAAMPVNATGHRRASGGAMS